jgi:peptidoglycan/LPS O-acetylase OafA/YrhL
VTASQIKPKNPRYASLDLWRGIACLMIVILHAAHNMGADGAPHGLAKVIYLAIAKFGVGVPMFFVISGYCIAATSDSTRRKPRAPALFFYRRFRRIFPPYWAAALLSIALVLLLTAAGQGDLVSTEYGLIPHPVRLSLSQWFGNFTLTETWRPNLFGAPELKIVGPAWTLCYEEQFYAVCGLLLVFAPRHLFAGAASITALTVLIAPLGFLQNGPRIQGFFFDGRWLMFAEGVAVYYALNFAPSRRGWMVASAMVLAATCVLRWGIPAVAAHGDWRDRAFELVASSAFALAILILQPWDQRLLRSRFAWPFAVSGQMCYSLYLIHWPITVVLTTAFHRAGVRGPWPTLLIVVPVALILSIGASWIFHVLVERRFLNAPVASPPTGRATALVDPLP